MTQFVTSEQVRAGRAILRWDRAELARRSGVSPETIKRIEKVDGYLMKTKTKTLIALHEAFRAAGLRFSGEAGEMGVHFPDPAKGP